MSRHEWNSMEELEFESMLESSVPQLPPDEIVAQVTPWKRAVKRVLIGIALGTVTLNFWWLNYLLPAIGMTLALLGFRTLRNENGWFRTCFWITVIRAVYLFATLVLNTMSRFSGIAGSPVAAGLSAANLALLFVELFALGGGLRAVQQKAGLTPHSGSAAALIVWYAILCLLAAVGYSGLILAGVMLIGYGFLLRSLWKLAKELEEAGYSVQAAPVRVADRTLVLTLIVLLLFGGICGYGFGGSYTMEWQEIERAEHADAEPVKEKLLALGFPDYVLKDLTAEEIAICADAVEIVVDVNDYPLNEGRIVTTRTAGEDGTLEIRKTRVYDVKELRITGVGVRLSGERETWRIFHHFLWTVNPGFYGTESIQLWPVYQNLDGWGCASEVSGRLLYEENGTTFTAPYAFLGTQSFTSNSIFWGEQTSTDFFAAFSLPTDGENQRGYLAYSVQELQDGWIIDSWVNYTHQQTWMQYPAMTAMQKRMTNTWGEAGAFRTVQDALQFYPTEEGAQLLKERAD